jgi:hypothetical protein
MEVIYKSRDGRTHIYRNEFAARGEGETRAQFAQTSSPATTIITTYSGSLTVEFSDDEEKMGGISRPPIVVSPNKKYTLKQNGIAKTSFAVITELDN